MKLTEHFTLASLLRSQRATREGISEQFFPSPKVLQALKALCENILEPLRQHIGKPIYVSSGYRCARVNRAIGGAGNSQHIEGQAADIVIEGMTNAEIISAIRKLELPVDQCIEEFHQWVHVSYGARQRREYLTASKNEAGKTIYNIYA